MSLDAAYEERTGHREPAHEPWVRPCVNLKVRFGDKYHIGFDMVARKGTNDPWMFTIPCKYGEVYPQGGERLAFHCRGTIMRGTIKRKFPNFEVRNWTDDGEAILVFFSDQFGDLAKVIKPKRKRRLSEEEKQRLAKVGLKSRFATAINDSHSVKVERLSQSGIGGRERSKK